MHGTSWIFWIAGVNEGNRDPGDRDKNPPIRFANPGQFHQHVMLVLHMLQRLKAEDEIEGAIRKGQTVGVAHTGFDAIGLNVPKDSRRGVEPDA